MFMYLSLCVSSGHSSALCEVMGELKYKRGGRLKVKCRITAGGEGRRGVRNTGLDAGEEVSLVLAGHREDGTMVGSEKLLGE